MPSKEVEIHFVLVRTQFASNLGTAVRALRNMGFSNLVLIQPECEIGIEARARAMKGAPILDRARYLPSLEAAKKEIGALAATTGRYRHRQARISDCRSFCREVLADSPLQHPLGVVFGPEDNGLRREELRLCQYRFTIPGASDYAVMNLSQAVAVVAYEMRQTLSDANRLRMGRPASPSELDALLSRVERILENPALARRFEKARVMDRLQRLARRTPLESEDAELLQALLQTRPLP